MAAGCGKTSTGLRDRVDRDDEPMEITFWGVRGSIPAPGPETTRYGGNTLCVEVRSATGKRIILDAGTGLSVLGGRLLGEEFGRGQGEAAIFLSHAHMDHIQGFPFFPPIYIPGNHFTIFGRERAPGRLEQVFEGQMNPNFSPIHSLKNLGATIDFHPLGSREPCEVAGLRVQTITNPHGSTTALAFRIEEDGRTLAMASDVGYAEDPIPEDTISFYAGADVLVHDCTYSPEDYAERSNRGFSSIAHAAEAAVRAHVKQLVMIHYDQDYTDDDVDRLAHQLRGILDEQGGKDIELLAAFEGLTIPV